jgi:dienelactone hydrolase
MTVHARTVRLAFAIALVAVAALTVTARQARAFDPVVEAQNFSKIEERQTIYNTAQYQTLLRQTGAANATEAATMQATDPERLFIGAHLCATGDDGCAGDVRLYDWNGIVKKVLFTARSGATISGRVWATKSGPAKRPGIVITNGSVQAPERLYWFAAQTLAKAGYVVLTSDPQGQGQSDERGETPDENEGSPAQSDGRPFYDGTGDALDFFLSTPKSPYKPRISCDSGTSHAPKQNRRVASGLNAAYNPLWQMLNPKKIGLAGHSYGAGGVSYVGQADPRVTAIVAWDNLGRPVVGSNIKPCPFDPASHADAQITKPALGMSADYGLTPNPNTGDPDPMAKSQASLAYSDAGVDTGELIIRGGTHYEFSFIPNVAFGGTLRGADMVAWYTTAWFDKYVKDDGSADKRLLTRRWQSDSLEGAIDPNGDPNMFSFYYPSRLDFRRSGGGRFACENLRAGCSGMVTDDGRNGGYSYLEVATSPDG